MNDWIKRLNVMGLGTLLTVAAAGAAPIPPTVEDKPALASWSLPWKGHGLFGVGRPAVATDLTFRLQAFVRVPATTVSAASSLWHVRQSGKAEPPWLNWESLGGSLDGDPIVGKSWNGGLEVFARGPGGILQHNWQTDGANDKWAGWESRPGVSFVGNPAVASNADGRLEVFVAVATSRSEYTLWHIRQVYQFFPPIPGFYRWSEWENLGGHLLGAPVVGRNKDGRLEVFGRAPGNVLAHIWQTSANSTQWSGWSDLGGGGLEGDPSVGTNADGRLEVFTRASDKAVWHIWQTSTVNILTLTVTVWSTWEQLGSRVVAGEPVVARDLDGRLEVFIRSPVPNGDSMWYTRQRGWYNKNQKTDAYLRSWSKWENLSGQLSSDPVVGTNWDGRLEAFCLAIDGGVYHMWQQPAIDWVLGSTVSLPIGNGDRLPAADLGANTMHNGRLLFYFGDVPRPFFEDPIAFIQPTGGAAESAQGLDFSRDRDPSRDFKSFDFLADTGVPFPIFGGRPDRIYPAPFRMNTSKGPMPFGRNQTPTGAFSYNHTVYVFAAANLIRDTVLQEIFPNPYDVASLGVEQSILTSSPDSVGPQGPFRMLSLLGPPDPIPPRPEPYKALGRTLQMTGRLLQVAPMVIKNAEIPGLPKTDTPDGLIMLGQGYDYPNPAGVILAWMPLRPNQDPRPSEMRFYRTFDANYRPIPDPANRWTDNAAYAESLFTFRYPGDDHDQVTWSSISLGRIRSTGRWIMLYQKTGADFENKDPSLRHDGIYARISTGTNPWDWSAPVTIFDPDRERAWGTLMKDEPGGFAYGAYLLNPYTNWDSANKIVTINYLMSPGSPYGVVLMRSQIRINN